FDKWSRRSGKYDADNTQKEWHAISRSPPTRIGAGTIFYHANDADPGWYIRSTNGSPTLQTSTPLESAAEFVQRTFACNHAACLIYYRGTFYEWVGSHYEEINIDHLRSALYQFLNDALTPSGKLLIRLRTR